MTDQNLSAALSTNSVHRVVPGSTHDSLVDNPKHTAAVIQAIRDVVVAVRSGSSLKSP